MKKGGFYYIEIKHFFMISTDQLDFKKHISLTGELVGIVILRRCSSLRDGSKSRGASVSGVGRDFLGFTTVALNKMMSGFVEFTGLVGTVGMVSSITSS